MSVFTDLRDEALATVDSTFAENIRLAFFTSSGTVDPSRPAREIKAILRVGEGKTINLGAGTGQTWSTRLYSGKAELHIDQVAWPGLVIRAKDRVRANDRLGQPWFEVAAVHGRGETRLVLALNQA